MAMNWGAFAGGAANSALGTYTQLNSERMKNLQTALFMEDMADKQTLKQASQETFGKVGTDQYENINSILEAKGAEVSPEAMAIEKPAAPTKYTEQQAVTDYGQKLSAIDPVRGFEFKGKALQIKTAQRQVDIDDKFDDLTKWRNDALTTGFSTLEGKGMSGMPDVLNPQLKKMGITVEYKGSETGPGSLVAKDDKGKVVGTYTGLDQVKTGFQGLVSKEYESRLVGLLGSADKALNYTLQREKVDLEREKVKSEVAKNQAMAGAYGRDKSTLGQIDAFAKTIVDSKKINPETKQPYTAEEAKMYASGVLFRDPNMKPPKTNEFKERALSYGEMLFESGATNPTTKKPYSSLEEAQKYAMGVALKDPAQAADSKQLSELEKIMLPKWPAALEALGPKATPAQVLSLAKQMGIRPEVLGISDQTVTQAAISKADPGIVERLFGPPRGAAPAEGSEKPAPRAAIPTNQPAPVKPLPERIAEAVRNPQALATLAYEAQQQIPLLQQKIDNANKVIPSLPRDAQDRMKAQIQESQRMLQLYQGVMQQRAAKTGLPN